MLLACVTEGQEALMGPDGRRGPSGAGLVFPSRPVLRPLSFFPRVDIHLYYQHWYPLIAISSLSSPAFLVAECLIRLWPIPIIEALSSTFTSPSPGPPSRLSSYLLSPLLPVSIFTRLPAGLDFGFNLERQRL